MVRRVSKGGLRMSEQVSDSIRIPISQLDDKTIGLISAGEVVERPAQVVKELLENSIDAGATRIQIEIERGGFDLISVTDNGHGIIADELTLSVTRHATSKLSEAADLAAIYTLGFRGEALASIGAVSHLKVASRPSGNQGTGIVVQDGDVSDLEPEGMAEGTSISVRGLFSNQPARLAFQRRPATETAQVVDVVVAHALCNPSVTFNLNVDGRQILETPSTNDMRDRLYDLLGASSEGMISLTAPEADKDAPGDEKWSGWISPPSISRGRSDDVHIIINGRPVAAQPFLQAIRRGYHTRLMVGRHPVAVLILELPADEVDVNVHPTKREVRLRNSWRVLERLERAIKENFYNFRKNRNLAVTEAANIEIEKRVFIQTIDFLWRSHLQYLEHLRQVVGLRGYAQKDPLQEFRREAFNLFEGLLSKIKIDFITFLNNLEIVTQDETTNKKVSQALPSSNNPKCLLVMKKNEKISRNEKCPATDKKYKHCCGAL